MKTIFSIIFLTLGIVSMTQAGQIDKLTKQCDQGDAKACTTAGALYAGARGNKYVKKDFKKAMVFWKRGCDLDNGSACTTYAMGIENEDERIKVLKKSCDLGNENGCLSYNQTLLLKTLQNNCLTKNDLKSCADLGGEIYLSGNYKIGKNILEDVCAMGDNTSCMDVKKIDALKDFRKLTLADSLAKKCIDKKEKYACEKTGTFLIEINSFISSKVSSKEEKKQVLQEVMMNMLMAQVYFKEGCKLGRKESCRTLDGLKKALDKQGK